MLRDDYDCRSTNELIEAYFRVAYGIKPGQFYDVEQGLLQEDTVYPKIKKMILDKKINEAEELLFDSVNPEKKIILKSGLMFYYDLNQWSDEDLEEVGFSKEEVKEGVHELLAMYGQDGFASVF